jgi:hypothetical protein
MALTQVDQGLLGTYAQYTGFKNRIINGAMVIDQRNAGASVTPASSQYLVDRWQANNTVGSKFTYQQNYGSVTPPAGFSKYLGAFVASAYSVGTSDLFQLQQNIEGFNCADLAWGTASAATVTLSFWVRSSLTGTFGGYLNGGQCYPFSYTINSANTWEQKTITIAGSTSGSWPTDNTTGIQLYFSLGAGASATASAGAWTTAGNKTASGCVNVVGTASATFYITGVQLEKGSTATSFDYRPYGQELLLAQRYFEKETCPVAVNARNASSVFQSDGRCPLTFKTSKRANPTSTVTYVSNIDNSTNASLADSNLGGITVQVNISNTTFAYASANITYTASSEL